MNDVFRGLADTQAEWLLAEYHRDTPFFFTTPEHTLLARGVHARLPRAGDPETLGRMVDTELRRARREGHPNPIVVGAIPFDTRQPACLCIPREVLFAGPLERRVPASGQATGDYGVQPVPEPRAYAAAVKEAVSQIKAGRLAKVVLARTLELTSSRAVEVQPLLERLARGNAFGYTFAVDLQGSEPSTLVGASPELLLSRRGLRVRSNPLAGSAARVAEPDEDARRSRALLESAKDLHEHRLVVDAVAAGLRPHCRTLHVPAGPSLLGTGTMWHLSTDIHGELTTPDASALRLAAALHPTPAVCGYPSDAAFELIARLDGFDRGFYTGMVGWCDGEGNGEWVVTLRCAAVQGARVRLFAGAGIVADSDPDCEVAETGAKFRTMLNALGRAREGAL